MRTRQALLTRSSLAGLWLLIWAALADANAAESAAAAHHRLPSPASQAWQPLTFPKINRHTDYVEVLLDDELDVVIEARANCSASGLMLALPDSVDLARTPRLRWRWRVESGLRNSEERSQSGDDFAARVYVLFEFNPAKSSAWERLRRRVGTALYGQGMPGKAIAYVWASHAKPGETWTNPYSEDTKVIALQNGTPGAWHTETVDLGRDAKRLLGEPHDPIMAIALMSDSDDTCQEAVAYYADFEFLASETNPASAP